MNVEPQDEIGPQLERRGVGARDVPTVVLTHFHTDHAGGLHHFPHSRILVNEADLRAARGLGGRLRGYLPSHDPESLQRLSARRVLTPGLVTYDGMTTE